MMIVKNAAACHRTACELLVENNAGKLADGCHERIVERLNECVTPTLSVAKGLNVLVCRIRRVYRAIE
jgi:hypothetical protein